MGYIINSLLDTDFYKFTMGQWVFHLYPDVRVTYALENRTKGVSLAHQVALADVRRELDHVRSLSFTNAEIHYLRGMTRNASGERMFREDYLEFLRGLILPSYTLGIRDDGQLRLEFSGCWASAIYWETPALAIIIELYGRSLLRGKSALFCDAVRSEGVLRLCRKIDQLQTRVWPDGFHLTFSDFGTRRRFGREWHEYVVATLTREFPQEQFLGTSNVELAMRNNLTPMGTCGHVLFMVMAALMPGNLRLAPIKVIGEWWQEYDKELSIALTDTFGSESFFRDMGANRAMHWKGLRQDSGDPFVFGERAIAFYKQHGIDPQEKLIVFSDGLIMETMIALALRFRGRIKTSFGWGTNLTNDMGFDPLSLVIKVVEANGYGTVKLSDNLAKAVGRPEDIARYKEAFGYTVTTNEPCRY